MFGIDFSELLVIGLVALVVIGPKRLPKTARTLGVLFGRGQRFVHDMKSQVEQEIHLQEISELQASVHNNAREIESTVQAQIFGIDRQLRETSQSVAAQIESARKPLEELPIAKPGSILSTSPLPPQPPGNKT